MLTLHPREGVSDEDYVHEVTWSLSVGARKYIEVDDVAVELLVVNALVLTQYMLEDSSIRLRAPFLTRWISALCCILRVEGEQLCEVSRVFLGLSGVEY